MKPKEIRQSFIRFFEEKNHKFIRSSSVVPIDDPTLLFTNAGMNQFKPIFLGEKPPTHQRAVNSQKCIRVSGKHNDLEEVGVDTFHHTFFEMLGNWSFGDYYKSEAIQWAWELVTQVWNLDKDRLWATVYEDDDEAFDLWLEVTDIAPDRVLRCGKKDNFWEMGATGPCGPCSEIHYYIGSDPARQSAAGVNHSDEYWELWNLVFIQFHRDEMGTLHDLPARHVDTGAGLERIAAVMAGKTSNYDTDLFQPIIHALESLCGQSYRDNPVPFRVIADHIRMLTFSIADGAMPSNEGRGYVLRRILRRAARFGRNLNISEPFLFRLVSIVGDMLGEDYPEIIDRRKHVENVIKAEEESFNKTLDRGLGHFERIISHLEGRQIPGEEVFRLYDTYGFPVDLTELIAREKGLTIDRETFEEQMARQRKRAKEAGKFKADTQSIDWVIASKGEDSRFTGYDTTQGESRLRRYAIVDDKMWLVLDATPFYAESGGQVGDTGSITNDGIDLQVVDVRKDQDTFIHICEGDFDERWADKPLRCRVDGKRRNAIRMNHTATHLLHKTLKNELGDHVHQAGSLVGPDYLRFDVTHFEKINADEIARVEWAVNEEIQKNIPVATEIKSFDEARESGAEALFGEKYGDEVRVITIGDYSKELCGGTHVNRTGDIGLFKIIEETSLAVHPPSPSKTNSLGRVAASLP
ncbi:MAG: alanine--tRNA ligase [Fidelibacterota bacterium]